ncbi:MAG: DUF2474 domain-containing protein [Betaproteobacteria bacterium]
MEHDAPAPPSAGRGRLWLRRFGWLVAYWLLGVLAVGAVAYGLRIVMGWVGLRI